MTTTTKTTKSLTARSFFWNRALYTLIEATPVFYYCATTFLPSSAWVPFHQEQPSRAPLVTGARSIVYEYS